jgi:uncharacterized protein YggE
MNKNRVAMAIVFCAIFLLMACNTQKQGAQSTVSVSGIGTVLVQPDMVQMNINFSHVAQTTQQAKREVDIKIRQIINILKADDIEDKDIKTVSLSYDAEMEYLNGRSVLTGQRAQQTIVVTINDIINNPDRLPELLDKITAVDRVVIRDIIFDTKDKTELFRQSRELAYQKALDKANQYAHLSGQKIVKVLTISEERSRDIFKASLFSNVAFDAAESAAMRTPIPTGEQEVTSEITVTFLMK